MHSRQGCYAYVKDIVKGESTIQLERKKEKVLRKLFFKKINSKKEIRQERVNNMLDIKFVRNNPDVVKQNIKINFRMRSFHLLMK